VGKDALEQLVWEQGQEAGILHLSTHGVYDQRSPLFSNVLLAGDSKEDGHLDVYEIYNRGLNLARADLVVLSACQSNVGELSGGDEIVGLSRALIYAGTPSVIASLWSVSDESTRVLMEKFYTHLRAGKSKAGALRAAQTEMIASGKYAHPYHWAAFGVTGDPGVSKGIVSAPTPTVTTQIVSSPTPISKGQTGTGICSAAVLPLVVLVLVGIRRRK
jgi:CHAT domain-containing protein